ncbi:hypothetical protein BK121_02360 [Paenibacillus odorifer]|uniref:outer membrane protein assembly factor BamB family protein n=1 Tax=Paenibacillus odorifer TaxID=189426 RepID=UPI00096F5E67|nr:PQQ-binding-like beta-propeller repeat protein [Paenibacillus odorifer]OMC74889.1 hypothetical protein BK121_02360 [Paenibacillus odorifer]
MDGVPYGRLVVNSKGHIYLCTYEDESQIIGRLYAFDADGTIRWVYKCLSIFWCDPVISREGIIYVGQNVNSKLYAFSPDGELLWEKRMGQGEGHRPPVIDQDGVMYGCLSSQLYAIAPDGEVKWIYQPEESYVDTSPSLGADGNLYVNLTGGEFICLTRDGEQLWKAETKGFAITQPILGRCGNVIQSRLMDNSIESYSVVDIFSQKGVHLAETAIKGSIHSVILANDEVIYVLSSYWTAKMEPKWELHLQISIGQSQGWTTVLGEKFNWETIGESARSLSNLKELKQSELQSDIIEQKNILTERSDEELLTSLQHADTSEADIRWYLTENTLGISVQISHAIGDHAEFEIKYDKLKFKLNTFLFSEIIEPIKFP